MNIVDNSPLISVFILCYNHEKYVAESIESVLNQTYSNIELIIVDNSSIDNSTTIIESYIEKDKRIRFIPMEYNTLVSYGCNIAIKECTGEYICTLSADDYFDANKIEIQLNFMLENKLDISFSWINVVNNTSQIISNHLTEKWFNFNEMNNRNEILKSYLKLQNRTNAATAMLSRNILDEESLFDNRLLQTQDYELWIRLLSKTENVMILDKKLTNYRVLDEGTNLSLSPSSLRLNRTDFEMIYVFKNFYNYSNELLSKLLDVNVNNDNKFRLLYEFFDDNNISCGKFAILLSIYDELGINCNINSEKFQFFFSKYSEFSFAYETQVRFFSSSLNEKDENIKGIQEGKDWLETQYESLSRALNEKDENIKDIQEGKDWLETQVESLTSVLNERNNELESLKKTKIYKFIKKVGLL